MLDRVEVPGSSVHSSDSALIQSLLSADRRLSGAAHQVRSARPVDGGTGDGRTVSVEIVDALPGYDVLDATGKVVGQTSSRSDVGRVLTLQWSGAEYRITAVLDPPTAN